MNGIEFCISFELFLQLSGLIIDLSIARLGLSVYNNLSLKKTVQEFVKLHKRLG